MTELAVKPQTLTVFSAEAVAEKRSECEAIAKTVNTVTITNQEQNRAAAALRESIRGERNALEQTRVALTKPLLDHKRTIDGMFKPALDYLDAAYAQLGKLIAAFLSAEDAKARSALQEAAAAHVAGDVPRAQVATALASKAAEAVAPGGTSVRWTWKARIVNASAVPRDWCCPDERRISEAARRTPADVTPTPIQGVEFYKEPIVATRSAK